MIVHITSGKKRKSYKMKREISVIFIIFLLFIVSSCTNNEQFESKTLTQPSPIKELPKVRLPESNPITLTGKIHNITLIATRYEFNPSIIKANYGDKIIITLKSQDTAHGFSIPAYNLNQVVKSKETTTFNFIADKKGEFPFGCSVVCGRGHDTMLGKLIVE